MTKYENRCLLNFAMQNYRKKFHFGRIAVYSPTFGNDGITGRKRHLKPETRSQVDDFRYTTLPIVFQNSEFQFETQKKTTKTGQKIYQQNEIERKYHQLAKQT